MPRFNKTILTVFLLPLVCVQTVEADGISFSQSGPDSLENGLSVILLEKAGLPLVSFQLWIDAGSAADPPGKEGLSNLTARLLSRKALGAGREGALAEVEEAGGEISIITRREALIIKGTVLSADLELGIRALEVIVTGASFSESEVCEEKRLIISEIESDMRKNSRNATRRFEEFVFDGHAVAHPPGGYSRTLKAIGIEDVVSFHEKEVSPEGAVLVIAGDIAGKKAMGLVRSCLGSWPPGSSAGGRAEVKREARYGGERFIVVDRPGLTQSYIRIGASAPSPGDEGYFDLAVANNILGVGFTSRLKSEIRVKRGLAYSARSRLSRLGAEGYFAASITTRNEALEEAVTEALRQIAMMAKEGAGEEELNRAKRHVIGLFHFGMQTREDICEAAAASRINSLGETFYASYTDSVLAVTSEGVRSASAMYLDPDRLKILIVTDYDATSSQLGRIGEAKVIPFDDTPR